MKLTTKQTNFRVVVSLDERGPYGLSYAPKKSNADDILNQIRKHVESDIPCSLSVDWDTVCAHCGCDPEIDEIEGPVCCEAALNEWTTSKEPGNAKP